MTPRPGHERRHPDPGTDLGVDEEPEPGGATDTDGGVDVADDTAPRSARILVAVLFVLLLVPGVIGFDLWPLTGWRLFSLSRDATQNFWVLEAVDGDGERQVVSFEELPLRYRHAAWPIADLQGASTATRDELCHALLERVVDLHPDTDELVIGRDHAELVERDGEWTTTHDIEPFHTCRVSGELLDQDAAGEGS